MSFNFEIDSKQWPDIWRAAYQILEQKIVEGQLKAWIQPLKLIETETQGEKICVHLAAKNDFSADWCRDHFQKDIEGAFSQVLGADCQVNYRVIDQPMPSRDDFTGATASDPFEASFSDDPFSINDLSQEEHEPSDFLGPARSESSTGSESSLNLGSFEALEKNNSKSVRTSSSQWEEPRDHRDKGIDPDYTFDNYIVGASNQFAYASAIAVAENPGRQYNPLFLYSHPGLGKTHLLYAIGNAILKNNPRSRICYLSAETFVNELIESLQKQKMPLFRKRFRSSYDVLLIDDIQFIAGKKQTEEEFFHTFNALYSLKKQIVLTSDRPPKEILKLEERIRTRFEWGLVGDISPPEIETRIAILKNKAEREDIFLPDDVATFLATHIKSNVRELEGMLIRLQAHASLTGSEISLEMTKNELKNMIEEEDSLITVESIQEIVSKHFQIRPSELKSTTRSKIVALPRQIAMFLSRKYTGLGYREIGQYFGGKDHTTVLHACTKIEKGLDQGKEEIVDSVQEIQNQL